MWAELGAPQGAVPSPSLAPVRARVCLCSMLSISSVGHLVSLSSPLVLFNCPARSRLVRPTVGGRSVVWPGAESRLSGVCCAWPTYSTRHARLLLAPTKIRRRDATQQQAARRRRRPLPASQSASQTGRAGMAQTRSSNREIRLLGQQVHSRSDATPRVADSRCRGLKSALENKKKVIPTAAAAAVVLQQVVGASPADGDRTTNRISDYQLG
jgi:hypothetical protein